MVVRIVFLQGLAIFVGFITKTTGIQQRLGFVHQLPVLADVSCSNVFPTYFALHVLLRLMAPPVIVEAVFISDDTLASHALEFFVRTQMASEDNFGDMLKVAKMARK